MLVCFVCACVRVVPLSPSYSEFFNTAVFTRSSVPGGWRVVPGELQLVPVGHLAVFGPHVCSH